jgi:N-acetylglucosaminyldiphosphoundecaprenol N-acetyl-beta-D-mannosaminyltransferase
VTSLEILGCRLDAIDAGEAVRRILTFAREAAGAQIVTLGTEMVVHAQNDPHFRAIVNGSALSLCDTVGLLTVARRRGAQLHDRVTGVELVEGLCAGAAAQGLPVYFLGGAEGVAADAAAILEVRFPGLRIAGTRSGYFVAEETSKIVETIRASGATLLLVAMGSPRQEFWLAEHLRACGCGVGIGVGGSFDVIGGYVQRAPRLVQRLGLEWLYRLAMEPRRWRRQLALPRFVWLIVLEELGLRPASKSAANS